MSGPTNCVMGSFTLTDANAGSPRRIAAGNSQCRLVNETVMQIIVEAMSATTSTGAPRYLFDAYLHLAPAKNRSWCLYRLASAESPPINV